MIKNNNISIIFTNYMETKIKIKISYKKSIKKIYKKCIKILIHNNYNIKINYLNHSIVNKIKIKSDKI